MSGKIEFSDLGRARVVQTSKKAALIELEDSSRLAPRWIPFSVMSSPTAANCVEDAQIESFRVERWFADKLGDEE